MTAKEEIIAFVSGLPDDATYPDIMDSLDARFGYLDDDGQHLSHEEWQVSWSEEVNRRLADLDAGRTKLIPGDEVMARMREKFG